MHLSSGGGPNCDGWFGDGRSAGQPVWQLLSTRVHVLAGVHQPTSVVPQLRVHLHNRPGIEHGPSELGSVAGQPPSVEPTPSGGGRWLASPTPPASAALSEATLTTLTLPLHAVRWSRNPRTKRRTGRIARAPSSIRAEREFDEKRDNSEVGTVTRSIHFVSLCAVVPRALRETKRGEKRTDLERG